MDEPRQDARLREAQALLLSGQHAAAEALCRELLQSGVDDADLLCSLAVICWQNDQLAEMEALLRRALVLSPKHGDAHYNLALALAARGANREAITHYQQALLLTSSRLQASVHWNLAKLLLRQGDYAAGWRHYEWRRRKAQPLPPICQPGMPGWDGTATIEELVLVGEQGLGDMIQFLRYAPLMRAFAPKVALCLPEKLHELVQVSGLGVPLLSPQQATCQRHGHWLPLLSAPGLLGVSPGAVHVEAPYLHVPSGLVQHWRQRLRAGMAPGERLVGLHWQGNPAAETSELRGRSLPLQELAPLADLAGVRFVSLQKGVGSEQLAGSSVASRLVACQSEVDACWDFVDTGAITLACDLLISSDSALPHLAGALGAPTWLLLHHSSDWRWGDGGERSFWYPALRLFRQQFPGDWAAVIRQVQTELEQYTPVPPESSFSSLSPTAFVDGWQHDVQALWDRNQHNEAIQLLLSRINGCLPDRPLIACKQFSLYLFLLGQYKACEQVLQELRQRWPDDLELLETQAVVLSRLGLYRQAIEGYEAVLRLDPDGASVNVWDGLAHARSQLGHHSEAVAAGEQALRIKDAHTRPLPGWRLPQGTPQEWLERHPGASVLAFSLWGENPRYLRGLLRNLLLIPALYPGWIVRVYLDRSVPQEFRTLAENLGAQLCLQPDSASLRERLCWRFQVANDASVGRFLVRDTDSVVNQREARAVQQWIDSDRWFHVMRDWWTHTDLVLAGMWGGVAGVLPDLMPLLQAYKPAAKETANVDQWFLRDCLWDALRRSVLSHDRCYRTLGSVPWPDPDPEGNEHVGQDEFSARRAQQRDWLWPWIQAYSCLQLPGELITSVSSAVPSGKGNIRMDLRSCRTVFISMEKDSPASVRMTQLLAAHGFRDVSWSAGVRVDARQQLSLSRERAHAIGVALAHRRALLDAAGEQPLLLLEDDVEIDTEGVFAFDLPADADAVWVGISRYGKPIVQPFSETLSRVSRMFSAHAILYLSDRYRRHVVSAIDQCIECNLPFDVALAFYQKDFSVYALNHALFYQAAAFGGAHDFEALTRGALMGA